MSGLRLGKEGESTKITYESLGKLGWEFYERVKDNAIVKREEVWKRFGKTLTRGSKLEESSRENR